MLSIDEAIAHAREVANTQRGKSGICLQNGLECEHFSDCLKCAEEHEQLAEWLEELKAIKDGSIPIIHGKAELELHDKVIRKEAIGDMVGNLIANSRTEIIDGKLMLIVTEERIKTVANEMKKQLDQLN